MTTITKTDRRPRDDRAMSCRYQRRFAGSAGAVPKARRFVADCLARNLVDEDATWTATLLVSELATNAVEHARTRFGVTVEVGNETVRVEVADGTGRLPWPGRPAPDALRGRGLLIVDELAERWDAEIDRDHPAGKRVWFELPRRR